MTDETLFFLDPDLRHRTRGSHITLFTLGCFLTLPALAVFYILVVALDSGVGSMSLQEGSLMVSAVLSSSLGVFAWAALGLLLTKPADPKWHATVWCLVIAFASVTLPSCVLWLFSPMGADALGPILVPVFIIAAASLAYGCRNLQMARHSLRRLRYQLAMTA